MSYLLEERFDDGASAVLGEAIFDLVVAKVIAARRASRLNRLTVVLDRETGAELARFDGKSFVPAKSGKHVRAADVGVHDRPTATLTRRKIG